MEVRMNVMEVASVQVTVCESPKVHFVKNPRLGKGDPEGPRIETEKQKEQHENYLEE